MPKKSTREEFVAKAKKIHGDKYDYSKVEYINNGVKVCIVCNEKDENGFIHGEFWQTPRSHLSKRGCPKCRGNRISKSLRGNKETFSKKANMVHHNKYDYTKVEYINEKKKVCIICPKHGEFWQTPDIHINNKAGCPKCKGERLTELNTKPWGEVLIRMRGAHGNKFEYDETTYINTHKKIRINCPIHGEFWQTPNSHIRGNSCPKCGGKHVTNLSEFISKSNNVHGAKYDYSKVEYTNTETKILITCPKHGEFWQTPHCHLRGSGCPHCKESYLEKEVQRHLMSEQIEHFRGKHFKWLGRQHLDFYIPKYNIGIECQGEQHFGFGGWAKGKRYERIKELDARKKQLCEENGIKLFYFSYEKFDKFLGEKVYHDIDDLIKEIKNNC